MTNTRSFHSNQPVFHKETVDESHSERKHCLMKTTRRKI